MQFRFLHTASVLLALMILLAGCTGSPFAPPAGTTPKDGILMSQLLLSPSEIPFEAADVKTQNPDMKEPVFSQFGGIQGMTRYSINEKTPSATSVQLGQTLVEYPPGNAGLAFAAFEQMTREADQSRYRITWLPDPGIGNRSCALIIADSTGADKPTAMIVFVKSNIMESVVMVAPSLDVDALTRAARAAAAKIP